MNIGKIVNNAFETVTDFGDQALTSLGIKDKSPAQVSLSADGSLRHNVDLEDFPPEMRAEAEAMLSQVAREVAETQARLEEARQAGATDEVDHLDAKLKELGQLLTDIKYELEHIDPDLASLASVMGPAGVVGLAAEGFRYDGKLSDCLEDAHQKLARFEGIDTAVPGAADAASGDTSMDGFADADEAVALFESDPKAFFDKLNSMGSEERAAWLMMVQQQIQQTNQLVTAITNFQKAQHDTQKAVLANLRV